jgi:hypothetical protein
MAENIVKDKDINPEEIVKLVMPLVKEEQKPKEEDIIEFLKKLPEAQKGSTRQELIDLLLTDKIAERLSNKEDLDLNKLLAIGLIKNILQPPQPTLDTNLLAALISKANNPNSDQWAQIMQLYLQQQAQAFQAQQQFNQQLMTMIFGQRLQQQDKQLEELRESINQQIEFISQQIEALRKQQPGTSLESEVQDWMKKKELLENIAEALRPEKIVKEGGKIDWGNILNRILKIGETFASKLPAQQPALRQIQPIPIQEVQPQQLAQPQTVQEVQIQPAVEQTPTEQVQTTETQTKSSEELEFR